MEAKYWKLLSTRNRAQEADQESAEAERGQNEERLRHVMLFLLVLKCVWVVSVTGKFGHSPRPVGFRSEATQRISKTELAIHRVMATLQGQWCSKAQPEGDVYIKETFHRSFEAALVRCLFAEAVRLMHSM